MAKITLTPLVDSLEAVPEKYRPFYEEKEDGKFALDADLAETLDTSGLKSALEKERKAARERAAQVSRWEALGKTPEEIEEMLSTAEEQAAKHKEKEGDIEGLKKQFDEKLNKALAPKDAKISKLEATLRQTLISSTAVSAIAAAKGEPELLLPLIEKRAQVVEEDGEYVVKVFRVDGKSVMLNDQGEPASITDLVNELKENPKYARVFDASGASGSGTHPSGTKAAGRSAFDPVKATPQEKSAFIKEHGLEAFTSLVNTARSGA